MQLEGGFTTTVHALVCRAFNGPPPTPLHEVAHWDNNRANNVPSNLRWATKKENEADRIRHGTRLVGSALPWAVMTEEDVRGILRLKNSTLTQRQIGAIFGCDQNMVSLIFRKKMWKHVTLND